VGTNELKKSTEKRKQGGRGARRASGETQKVRQTTRAEIPEMGETSVPLLPALTKSQDRNREERTELPT